LVIFLWMSQIAQKRTVHWFLKEWREYRDLTQEQLAEKMGTTKGTISKLETGAQPLRDKWVALSSLALGIQPRDLLRHPKQPKLDDVINGWLRDNQAPS
jgi:transcriptional regulator with XRE-family HTH domain